MQSKPYATYEEAKKAAAEDFKNYYEAYARPNPNEEEGGYVVIYGNDRDIIRPVLGGCPHGR